MVYTSALLALPTLAMNLFLLENDWQNWIFNIVMIFSLFLRILGITSKYKLQGSTT